MSLGIWEIHVSSWFRLHIVRKQRQEVLQMFPGLSIATFDVFDCVDRSHHVFFLGEFLSIIMGQKATSEALTS